jgi:AAA domain
MAFGFAGAHRTGKTTLAKLVAEDLGWHYHDASVSRIMKEAGINAVGDVPMEARIEAQEFLLQRYLQNLSKAPRPIITDRTPLDMVGYCLGEVTMHNTTPELGMRIDNYVHTCLCATLEYFDTVIVVGQLPTEYAVDPTKPPPNLGYQTLVQLLIEGAAVQINHSMYIEWLDASDLQERRNGSKEILMGRMAQLTEHAKQVSRH